MSELLEVEAPGPLLTAIQQCERVQAQFLPTVQAHVENEEDAESTLKYDDADRSVIQAFKAALGIIVSDGDIENPEKAFYCASLLHKANSNRAIALSGIFPGAELTPERPLEEVKLDIEKMLKNEEWPLPELLGFIIAIHYTNPLESDLHDLMMYVQKRSKAPLEPNVPAEDGTPVQHRLNPLHLGKNVFGLVASNTELAVATGVLIGGYVINKIRKN